MTLHRAFWVSVGMAAWITGCAVSPGSGEKAPAFSAALDTGEKATFESLMGENGLILYFYPKDETPGCIKQACQFRDRLVEFTERGYKVVGVSMDTPESHKAFKENQKLPFQLVSDPEKSIAALYNVPVATSAEGTVGYKRTTFVISKDGIIRRRFEVPDPLEQVTLAAKAIQQPF
jgi:peroxiredoxin Q/BCP